MSSLRGSGGIFISYRRQETAAYAGRLYDRLSEHFGEDRVFMDVDSIAIGVDFTQAIRDAVSGCRILLALIGQDWPAITDDKGRRRIDNPDDFVRVEIETALQRDIRVVPVLVDGATVPDADELPQSLRPLVRRQALALTHIGFRAEVSRLVAAVDEVIGADVDEVIRTEPGRSAPTPEVPNERPQREWQGQIRAIKVSATVNDTEVLINLTYEDHGLVARFCMARDYLKLDGRKVASPGLIWTARTLFCCPMGHVNFPHK